MTPPTATADPPAATDDIERARQRREAEEKASDAEAVRAAGGTPDPDLPGEGEDAADEVITQLSIAGDADVQLSTVGGRKPDQSTLTVKGGEITVAGAVKKGQRVRIVLEGPIAETHFIDIRDSKTGDVSATKRKHVLKPDFIERQEIAAR
jgi:hypothetical protein